MKKKPVLVISAINFFEGGPLSVLKDCLSYLNQSDHLNQYRVFALVHDEYLFDKGEFANIEFVTFSKSRKSYLFRLYYEYVYFKKYATVNNVGYWLSLHDITPRLKNVRQSVYCHNASPFNQINYKDIFVQPTVFLFRLFYKYFYKINIHRNEYVIVQQQWIKNKFQEMFNLPVDKIVVSIPKVQIISSKYLQENQSNLTKVFFFPTYPRPFKNIEVIGEAVKLLNADGITNFKVLITINGTENKYAQIIINEYGLTKNMKFIGLLKRDQVYETYAKADCLIFPSKLESWGLPISEFKQYNKPMLVANLPYAKETVGDYNKVKYFDPLNAKELAGYMKQLILDEPMNYKQADALMYTTPYANSWNELFSILLK